MGDQHTSLREPLLDPEMVENSNYWVQCRRPRSEGSLGLEDVLRSWYDQRDLEVPEAAGVQDGCGDYAVADAAANGDDPDAILHSERPCRPWYRNPLQIMAMCSNFSTSFNVVNISLVLPILKVVLKDMHPVNAEDEVSVLDVDVQSREHFLIFMRLADTNFYFFRIVYVGLFLNFWYGNWTTCGRGLGGFGSWTDGCIGTCDAFANNCFHWFGFSPDTLA